MKNFSISCVAIRGWRRAPGQQHGSWLAALLVAVLVITWVAVPVEAKRGKKRKRPPTAEELFNPLLGVDYSHWLVGPVVRIASENEIAAYLALTDDEQADAFIEDFWAQRNKGTEVFKKTPRQIYAARVVEADKRFTQEAYPGSRTDRGTVFVIYGEPEEITYETLDKIDLPPLEVFNYSKDAAPGLDGQHPDHRYRFVDLGDLTVLYTGQKILDPIEAKRRRLQRRGRF